MRYIKRDAALAPFSLRVPGGKGENEKIKIAKHYQTAGVGKFDSFSAYKEHDVQEAIRSQFNLKCVYCESSYAATSPGDIEHYRPKGGITGEPNHLGYWWLAGVWENLLASCPDCNRSRYQVIVESTDTTTTKLASKLSGKENHFPILGVRAKCETDDHLLEDPLLIDPTDKDPSKHIFFTTDTLLSIVLPINTNGSKDRYGAESIEAYGLNRVGLVDTRTAFLKGLQLQADTIDKILHSAVQPNMPVDLSKSLVDLAFTKLAELATFADPKKIYSALAATFYDEFHTEITTKYHQLLKKT